MTKIIEYKLDTPRGLYGTKHWTTGHSENKQTIICFHGWLDNAASFDNLAPSLAHNYEVYAFDLPGHGHSFHRQGQYLLTEYLLDIKTIIQTFDEPNALTLLGHSMGAGLISILTSLYPNLCANMILLDFIGALTHPEELIHHSLKRHLDKAESASEPSFKPLNIEKIIATRARLNQISLANARMIIERNIQQSADGSTWRSDPKTKQPSPWYLTENQVCHLLKENKHSALLLISEESDSTFQAIFNKRAACMESITVQRIQGNHFFHVEHPEISAKRILDFLQR